MSLTLSYISQHCQSDHSKTKLHFSSVTSDDNLSYSVHNLQQVTDSQINIHYTQLSNTHTHANQSSALQDSQQVSENQVSEQSQARV